MDTILLGFSTLFAPITIAFLLLGVFLGLIIGSVPGLNENIAFAVFLPFSFALEPGSALALMVGVYCATAVGGSIPAIMLKVPGTASAVLTAVDGNTMARKDKANTAVSIAVSSSVFGGLTSSLVLLFFAPTLAGFALRFGYVENFALCVLGLSAVIGMLEKNVLKGFLSGILGLMIATVGLSLETGYPRFTFDNPNLYEGVPFVPMLVGLFGITAALELVEDILSSKRNQQALKEIPRIKGSLLPDSQLIKRLLPTWCTASAIGNVVGVLPGAGMIMAIYLAYNQAANRYKHKFSKNNNATEWGEGTPEGIASPEAANNAVVASSMVPLLALGIPGNSVSALFIGALMIHGMVPGPLLFMNNADIAWMIICAFFVANLVMGPFAIVVVKYVSGLIYKLPKFVLVPTIILLCLSGAYADGNSIFNIWVAVASGIFGYLLNKFSIQTSPLILALVLGEQLEDSFSNSMTLSDGNLLIFFDFYNHPISASLMIASILFTLLPIMKFINKTRTNIHLCSAENN
ncbi:C4-dicarboxylate ABC transporter [Vibrio sp. HA2012]|uniref:tripartite tricarboxylate transporter permease n=1 Tax=Vibrio sp. HA2012 TaxID=1971595 RepID=UPI000C2C1E1D|nr:tripartite tricarboxylate transporter permease [Vibrio sp. HA2012]PJC86845.1 C4-dicarboxylate ABC transporter [Vibrio sp. HA2012]